MVWAAFDRAVRAVEEYGLAGPVDEWRTLRDEVRAEVLEHGFDAERNTFVQHYDTTEVDASLLVLPQIGFIDGDDPRMLGTIEAIEQDLLRDGLLLRYRTRDRRRRPRRRRAPVPGLLVLAGLGVRRGRPHSTTRTRSSTGWSAWSTTSGCCRRSTTRSRRADGRQLPAGVQPPGPGPGGVPAAAPSTGTVR